MIGKMDEINKHKVIIKSEFDSYLNDFEKEHSENNYVDIIDLIEKYRSKLTDYIYKNYPSGNGMITINGIRDTHPLDKLHIILISYAYELNEKYLEFTENEND